MSKFWHKKKVLVTGGTGFIGSYVVEMLVQKGANVTVTVFKDSPNNSLDNLSGVIGLIKTVHVDLTKINDCLCSVKNQEIVFNLAALDGGAGFKKRCPARIFRQNLLINLQMLEAAQQSGIDRFLIMSSSEVYSANATDPLIESQRFSGIPNRTSDGYAWSKRVAEFAAEFFSREYDLKIAIARPGNVYGPRDCFEGPKCRVIPTFIKKAFENRDSLIIWGTGKQTLSFLYVEDLARALLDLVEKYPACEPVNLGGVEEITIEGIASLIMQLCGKDMKITCDLSKPSGRLRRVCSIAKAKEKINFSPRVSLKEGIHRTVDFYLNSMKS